MKKIFYLFILCNVNGFCQDSRSIRDILHVAFNDQEVFEYVQNKDLSDKKSIYIFAGTLDNKMADYDSLINRMGPRDGGLFPFLTISNGEVYLFLHGHLIINSDHTNPNRVVIVECLSIKDKNANVVLRTTNLDSRRWHKAGGNREKFSLIKCQIIKEKGQWILKRKQIRKCDFKSIVD